VYDSFYGNTKQVALAIGDSLASFGSCDTLHVDEITPEHLKGIDILIVGSPTRAFRPTKSISSLLDVIPQGALKGIGVAAFDTRMAQADVPPEGFFVEGLEGPLKDNELQRASAWVESVLKT